MAKTKATKTVDIKKKPASKKESGEPKTVRDAKVVQAEPGYWRLTDDEILLRSPVPEDAYKTSDSWRVFRIMGEFVEGFDELAEVRSEEHTSELQSQSNLVCRLLLEKKKNKKKYSKQ